MSAPPTPADLLLEWDRQRPRSQQADLGMSAVGGCRRYAGYVINGVEPTDDGASLPAVLGTAIHEVLADAARKRGTDRDLVEAEVYFAGIRGHVDWARYDEEEDVWDVIDWKSVSQNRYSSAVDDGPDLNQLHQTCLYAAALGRRGYRIRHVILDYIGRDSGKLHRHVRPFRIEEVREAVAWLDNIRTAELEALPRDFRPGSAWCDGCEFRSACWDYSARPKRDVLSALFIDHPDAAAWQDQFERGKAMKAEGERLYKDAKGALDAIRPNDKGRSAPCVIDGPDGQRKALRWSVYEEERLDNDAVRADYAAVGARPPVRRSEVVKLSAVPRPKPDELGSAE